MVLNLLILTLTFLINLGLAFLILLKNRRRAGNQSFAFFLLCVAGWTGSIILTIATQQIFWGRLSFVFGSLIPSSLLLFVVLFKPKPAWRPRLFLIFAPSAIFAVVSYAKSDWIFSGVNIVAGKLQPDARGPLYPLFGLYLIIYTLAASTLLAAKIRKAAGIYKIQLSYLLLGIGAFATMALATNVVLPWLGNNSYNSLGPLFSIIMVAFISYAILRHRFLEIKIVIETALTYVLSILMTVLVWMVLERILGRTRLFAPAALNFGLMVVALMVYPKFKEIVGGLIESINRPSFNFTHSLKNLAESLTRYVDLEEITRVINETITQSLGVKAAATAIFEKDAVNVYSSRPYPASLPRLLKDGPLLRYLNDFKAPLVKEELHFLTETLNQDNFLSRVAGIVSASPAEIFLPLIQQNKLIGVITLEKKSSGEAFTKRELEMLETLAYQAAIAIANGKLYKEIKDLNLNLKNKVAEQTKHLNRLLKVKDDFVKITSHQLRTPTTIIKGMMSLVLEGSLDHDEAKKRQYLDQAYASIQNLEKIIGGILDASDLAAGKLNMEFEPADLSEIARKIVDERNHLARERNLELKLEVPENPLPKIYADPVKLGEAVANLIDNAIKYTPQGKVCVRLEPSQDGRWMTLCVQDSGIGVKPEDKKRIFKKFARTEQSTMMNPNGSGLGLYVVKQIVDAHHGHIEVESGGENKGSIFKIIIPIDSQPRNSGSGQGTQS